MIDINGLDADSILADEVFTELFSIMDPIERSKRKVQLTRKAKELKVKIDFEEILKGYAQAEKEMIAEEKQKHPVSMLDNFTNFTGGQYDNMFCKGWIANDSGIFAQTSGGIEEVACYHPILPIERLKNLETGEEQIKLAYKRNNRWHEIIVPKTMITSANKIVALSGRGIAVTSENARLLVKYLADVENGNDDEIEVQYSSSKLGWIGTGFIPYDDDIIFDGDSRFRQAFESVSKRGDYDIWLNHVRELRASGRIELKFLLAASFASVLVQKLGGLPFFVDLWGETEGGKTVSLMVAASVWANPDGNAYIGDFKTTDVALEAKADMLNNLPMLLDDTSKVSKKIGDNFEGIVYDLCSGKGKTRSNKDLGINRENRWKNVFISNGERPLSGYVYQGGAINRILEVECKEKVFADPQHTAELMKKNYGFAGEEFVEIIQSMSVDTLKEIQSDFLKKLYDIEKMQKQSISLSIVLTADKIITEHIFKDGQYISMEDAKKVLIDRNELSDNERCYQFILDKVAMNNQRFDSDANCEKWGIIENDCVILYNQAFNELCDNGHFSKKSFLSWAMRNGVVLPDSKGNPTKQKKIDGKNCRCVFIRFNNGVEIGEDGFMMIGDQEELPFD